MSTVANLPALSVGGLVRRIQLAESRGNSQNCRSMHTLVERGKIQGDVDPSLRRIGAILMEFWQVGAGPLFDCFWALIAHVPRSELPALSVCRIQLAETSKSW